MQATDAAEIPLLKAANPNLKILLYQEPLLARPTDPTGLTVCSTWNSLDSSDPTWMLHDQNDDTMQDVDESGNYLMDLGNAQYQQSCVAHAIALAKQVGADGVYFDDINASVNWYVPSGDTVPEYPTVSSWDSAETSFLTYATAQLHDNGMLSFANLGGAGTVPGLWEQWSGIVDGSQEQAWNDWGAGSASSVSQYWQGLLQEPIWSEAHDKYTILESDDNGEQQNTFGLASMMLVAGGWTSYCTANLDQVSDEQWYPTYTAAQTLGAPLGPYTELSDGLYERSFTDGLVVVNPTMSNATVTLPRSMVDSATGDTETTLSAAATSGYILQSN